MKNLLMIALLVLVLLAPATVSAQPAAMWVEVLHDGEKVPLERAVDHACQWVYPSPALLNRPGECGRPANATNVLMAYAHNIDCDRIMCHYSRTAGGVFAWGAMVVGDSVQLFDGARLWQGRVIEVIHEANLAGIQPQDDFACPRGFICGSLTTCADLRPAYIVIRVAYR